MAYPPDPHPTFLEWCETLPEGYGVDVKHVVTEFFRAAKEAVTVTDINIAAGLAYQALTGSEG